MAIYNAIIDFSHSCDSLYSVDSVFAVGFEDSIFSEPTLIRLDEKTWGWKRGKFIDGIVLVGIIGSSDQKFLITNQTKLGYQRYLPTRYLIRDGKLFYWHDDNYPLTQEMLDILSKYNLLQDDEGGMLQYPDNPTDDSKQGAHYYFCKKDLSKYEKVVTSIARGYYQPPEVECD